MNFLLQLTQLLSIANTLMPIIAAARRQADPAASNAALTHATQLAAAVTPLVDAAEAVSSAQAAAGQPKLAGADKLAIVQSAVQQSHDLVIASGGTAQNFDEVWLPVNAAVTAVVAAKKLADAQNAADAPQ